MRPKSEPVKPKNRHRALDRDETSDTPGFGIFDTFEPRVTQSDVILPRESLEAVEDALYFVRNRTDVMKWTGLDRTLEKGKGLSLLFYGPPGTGKSITAEAFAAGLGKPLIVVRPEAVESSYFGATENNISRLFDLALSAGTVVLFDEYDSFFTTRPVGEA